MTIWSNAQLPQEAMALLREGLRNHELVLEKPISNLSVAEPDPRLLEADIAFGQPDPGLMIASSSLRWMHLTSAGYTRYDREDLRQALRTRQSALSNSSSVYDEPCAQHVLAFMLCDARQLRPSIEAQPAGEWRYGQLRGRTRVLMEDTVLLLGFGAIARRLVQLLQPFGCRLVAFRQHPTGDEPVETHFIDQLAEFLPSAGHVVNTLPASPSTEELFGAKLIELMSGDAMFYNIGRGTTVDQEALATALAQGAIRGAYLDVTDPEPLPASHPLWKLPNCVITPHIGGGFAREYHRLVEHFLENLRRFEEGQPLLDRIV